MIKGVELLPRDGSALLYSNFLTKAEADALESILYDQLNWQSDIVKIFGRTLETQRKMAWYADMPFDYKYSGISHLAADWHPVLRDLRDVISSRSGYYFNSCLANKYENGAESMGWHSDDEASMAPDFPIASISLGAERRFLFRHRSTKEKKEVLLPHGSLLLMIPPTQKQWLHCLPKMAAIKRARVNLTFRQFQKIR